MGAPFGSGVRSRPSRSLLTRLCPAANAGLTAMRESACVQFELLGPLRVVEGDSDRTPVRPKQRALLALLILRRGEVVPGAQLIEAMWGEEPPGTAQTALHGHISSLRKALGADLIRTRPPGYLLQITPDEIDLARFEELIAAALAADDPAERSAR